MKKNFLNINVIRCLIIVFSLLISCSNDDTQETKTDSLASILSDCDMNREIVGNLKNLGAQVVFNENSGLFYFREVTGFDSQNNMYVCTVAEKFKKDGLIVSITGILKLFTEKEKETLHPSPVGTNLYLLEPTKIEAIN